jgi:phospholipase/carboxylesterase
MHKKQILYKGRELSKAKKVLIMVHGRGGSAEDILSLGLQLNVEDYALAAPQATNNTWYPYSFMAPQSQNELWLSSALSLLTVTVADIQQAGIPAENIFFLGFSQGACLTLEFVTRNARRWGGVVAFTGGLVGEVIDEQNYSGNFLNTPVFIGTSDPDPHVPVERVHESSRLISSMNAVVTTEVYPNMGHTITKQEMAMANKLIFI